MEPVVTGWPCSEWKRPAVYLFFWVHEADRQEKQPSYNLLIGVFLLF
nr:MAG TPA: hypothetical protein [Caudoviricetes sp.]